MGTENSGEISGMSNQRLKQLTGNENTSVFSERMEITESSVFRGVVLSLLH